MLKHTQTHSKFQYIFTALKRDNMAVGTVRVSIEANTLHEAKANLKARYTAIVFHNRQLIDINLAKFTWRFLALSRTDMKAKPCRLSAEAYTEHEARKILASHFILSFAARLPVEANHG